MYKNFVFGALILLSAKVNAQVKITELYLQSGAFFNQAKGSLADFQALAPQSSILQQDLSLYQNNPFFNFNLPGQAQTLSAGLQLAKLPNATLRVGLTHINQGSALSYGGSYTESFTVDTLTSSQTGEQFFIDSFSTHGYNARYSQEQLRLDASLIFRLNGEKRWSIYGGIGANIGLSYNCLTTVHHGVSPNGDSQFYGIYNDYMTYQGGVQQNETFENKGGIGVGIYAPLGIDFQVGKKRDFWKPFHLYVEMRPGLNISQISGLGTSFSAGGFSNFGLRVKFN
ncbi:MAG: hypothetical protein ACKOWW_03815 [Flavobacteriales bacterium]